VSCIHGTNAIPVNVADRETGSPGGVVRGLPVRVINRGLEPKKVPGTCIAASNVVAVPVQPMTKYSASAPGATFGRLTMPPLNLPAIGCIPVVAMSDQPGFAAKKPAMEEKFATKPPGGLSGVKAAPAGAARSST
jgi:hypothetical protein